mmetsp:Transcript_13381/g.27155  ORF Transcript_13381/g.27155 Transcript_13381/m.27155 type:complete len:315 (+) Transcript_13381:137-1081(+)
MVVDKHLHTQRSRGALTPCEIIVHSKGHERSGLEKPPASAQRYKGHSTRPGHWKADRGVGRDGCFSKALRCRATFLDCVIRPRRQARRTTAEAPQAPCRRGKGRRARVAERVAAGERGFGLHALRSGHVAVVQPQLSDHAGQEEDTSVVASERQTVESVRADVLPRCLAIAIHENLRLALVKDRRVHVPVASSTSAATQRILWGLVMTRCRHADFRRRVPARGVAMANLEAARLGPKRVDDRGITSRPRYNHECNGLLQRLCKRTCLEDRVPIKLERSIAVDSVWLESHHAVSGVLVHGSSVAITTQIAHALDI